MNLVSLILSVLANLGAPVAAVHPVPPSAHPTHHGPTHGPNAPAEDLETGPVPCERHCPEAGLAAQDADLPDDAAEFLLAGTGD